MSSIDVKAERGKVNVRFPVLGGKRYRMGITPGYARTLSLRLQEAADEAETMGEEHLVDESWGGLMRWLKRFGGGRG